MLCQVFCAPSFALLHLYVRYAVTGSLFPTNRLLPLKFPLSPEYSADTDILVEMLPYPSSEAHNLIRAIARFTSIMEIETQLCYGQFKDYFEN